MKELIMLGVIALVIFTLIITLLIKLIKKHGSKSDSAYVNMSDEERKALADVQKKSNVTRHKKRNKQNPNTQSLTTIFNNEDELNQDYSTELLSEEELNDSNNLIKDLLVEEGSLSSKVILQEEKLSPGDVVLGKSKIDKKTEEARTSLLEEIGEESFKKRDNFESITPEDEKTELLYDEPTEQLSEEDVPASQDGKLSIVDLNEGSQVEETEILQEEAISETTYENDATDNAAPLDIENTETCTETEIISNQEAAKTTYEEVPKESPKPSPIEETNPVSAGFYIDTNLREINLNEIAEKGKLTIINSTISSCKLHEGELHNALIKDCKIESLSLLGSQLKKIVFNNCTVVDSSFKYAEFPGALFIDCAFVNVNFNKSIFENFIIQNCSFDDCDSLLKAETNNGIITNTTFNNEPLNLEGCITR